MVAAGVEGSHLRRGQGRKEVWRAGPSAAFVLEQFLILLSGKHAQKASRAWSICLVALQSSSSAWQADIQAGSPSPLSVPSAQWAPPALGMCSHSQPAPRRPGCQVQNMQEGWCEHMCVSTCVCLSAGVCMCVYVDLLALLCRYSSLG